MPWFLIVKILNVSCLTCFEIDSINTIGRNGFTDYDFAIYLQPKKHFYRYGK